MALCQLDGCNHVAVSDGSLLGASDLQVAGFKRQFKKCKRSIRQYMYP